MPAKTGYCLWCGKEITVAGIDPNDGSIEWQRCNAPYPCQGGITTVITDKQGFVIYPFRRRGSYIYSNSRTLKHINEHRNSNH